MEKDSDYMNMRHIKNNMTAPSKLLQMNKEHDEADPLNRTLAVAPRNMTELNGKVPEIVRDCAIPLPKAPNLFRFSTNRVNWNSAKLQCESKNSHLIIVNKEQEQNFIKKSLENNPGHYWIGLTDRESEGNWKWVDGTPVSFNQWYQGELNNWKGNENCALIRPNGWNDYNCSDHFPFICKKRALPCVEAADIEKYCS